MSKSSKTAVVTGANSGLGLEAAAQLAADGWGKVILACRSLAKAESARQHLTQRTGRDVFEVLEIDTAEVDSAHAAADRLAELGTPIDLLLLNAGASHARPEFNSAGVEITYASTLVGHHVLAMRLLAAGLLTSNARIVIAGSEGARGNFPMTSMHDFEKIAASHFQGDWSAAIQAIVRVEAPGQRQNFDTMSEYCTAKLLVAWWAAAVARQLPAGMTVNAVSPGSVPTTNFSRDLPPMVRYMMFPMMKVIGPFFGMAWPIEAGARRYLDAAEFGDQQTGEFYATAGRTRLAGPMAVQTWPDHFTDERGHLATLDALSSLTGVGFRFLSGTETEIDSPQERAASAASPCASSKRCRLLPRLRRLAPSAISSSGA